MVTSCLVEALDDVPQKKRKLSKQHQAALDALDRLIAERDAYDAGLLNGGERGVEVSAWDEAMTTVFKAMSREEMTDGAIRGARKRAKDALKGEGRVEFSPDEARVWSIAQKANRSEGY